MGAALLDHHLRGRGTPATVASAGTTSTSLSDADPRAVAAVRELGLTIDGHRPRVVDREILATDGEDLVLTMTRQQLRDLVSLDPSAYRRTFTVQEFLRRALVTTAGAGSVPELVRSMAVTRRAADLLRHDTDDDIVDPTPGSAADVRACARLLDTVTAQVAATLSSRDR